MAWAACAVPWKVSSLLVHMQRQKTEGFLLVLCSTNKLGMVVHVISHVGDIGRSIIVQGFLDKKCETLSEKMA